MTDKLPDYFKTQRKLYGMTQKEVAYLLGYMNGQEISRIERRERIPSLRIIVAYSIIFSISVNDLIPGIYQEIEESIEGRVKDLIHLLEQNQVKMELQRKIEFLRSLVKPEEANNTNIHENQ